MRTLCGLPCCAALRWTVTHPWSSPRPQSPRRKRSPCPCTRRGRCRRWGTPPCRNPPPRSHESTHTCHAPCTDHCRSNCEGRRLHAAARSASGVSHCRAHARRRSSRHAPVLQSSPAKPCSQKQVPLKHMPWPPHSTPLANGHTARKRQARARMEVQGERTCHTPPPPGRAARPPPPPCNACAAYVLPRRPSRLGRWPQWPAPRLGRQTAAAPAPAARWLPAAPEHGRRRRTAPLAPASTPPSTPMPAS